MIIGFKLFTSLKNKKKQKIWVPVSLDSNFPIHMTMGQTCFSKFQELVAAACNKNFAKTGPVILKSIEDPKTKGYWVASIPCVEDWKKSNNHWLINPENYKCWLESAFDSKRKVVNVTVKMPNPADAKKQALKEDLLAKQEA
ncbi:hypothetical protein PTTG_03253 [Puccinia triticina 1-1 BBBD Race 1]|uniref:Uncharacterized protein n=1 Tax=Puccinia triticina (isolate 1-1 / race 1 (BBBD)) TaxID=630390 RepID=A0A0C4ER41_PUCT1|nr:hypothetical protein PTTG_03253 [Puccinia triticina 1-1 BBBD Race 1]